MKRTWIVLAIAFAGLAGFGLAIVAQWVKESRGTTLTRLSPDETLRARLLETSRSKDIDRDFQLQLENLVDQTTKVLFRSPDEGRPEGTERLIWSRDGKWLLLVGRHFFVKEDLFLDNGDQLFFLYHQPSGKSWLNSAGMDGYPALKAETIEGVEFTEPVKLKAR